MAAQDNNIEFVHEVPWTAQEDLGNAMQQMRTALQDAHGFGGPRAALASGGWFASQGNATVTGQVSHVAPANATRASRCFPAAAESRIPAGGSLRVPLTWAVALVAWWLPCPNLKRWSLHPSRIPLPDRPLEQELVLLRSSPWW